MILLAVNILLVELLRAMIVVFRVEGEYVMGVDVLLSIDWCTFLRVNVYQCFLCR